MKKYIINLLFFTASVSFLQACTILEQDANVKVVSIKKIINKNTPDYEICSSFTLTKRDVIKYFNLAEQVDEYEFHTKAIILPCKYQGSMNVNGDLLQWEIIAGGAGYLYNDKLINKRYLCTVNCCNSLPNLC